MKFDVTNIVRYFFGVLIAIGIALFSRFFLEHKPERLAKDSVKIEKTEKKIKSSKNTPSENVSNIAEEKGIVSFIPDGDTIHLEIGLKVRLLGINCPEIYHDQNLSEKFAKEAQSFLSSLVLKKEIVVKYRTNNKEDQYQRLLGEVYVGTTHINLEMIKNGYAFVYATSTDEIDTSFFEAEKVAQQNKLGLWGVENDKDVFEKFSPKFDGGDLSEFVDKTVSISGVVKKYSKNKGAVVLSILIKDGVEIRATLSKKNYIHFPILSSEMFLNKQISLIGRVIQYKENYEISIRYPTQFILQ